MKEENLQIAVCDYIRAQYPNVIFNSDLSGIKLTMGQAVKAKRLRSSKGFPDLVIYEPRGDHKALFIELKREGEKICKKDGELKTDHLKEQSMLMEELRKRGYYCVFAIGFDQAKMYIDNYLTCNNG